MTKKRVVITRIPAPLVDKKKPFNLEEFVKLSVEIKNIVDKEQREKGRDNDQDRRSYKF